MKNLVQQRHLRRVCWRLIVSLTSRKRSREENEKRRTARNREKEKELQREAMKKNDTDENGISDRELPPLSICG